MAEKGQYHYQCNVKFCEYGGIWYHGGDTIQLDNPMPADETSEHFKSRCPTPNPPHWIMTYEPA